MTRSVRWAPAPATRPHASRRCARPSTGATSCSATPRRQCFARFAVFAGGATVQSAETITGAGLDTLDDLVAKSLLVRRHDAHSHPAGDARNDPRLRRRALHGRRGQGRRPRTPLRLLPRVAQRQATEVALWGANRNDHLAELDAEMTTYTPPSSGRSARRSAQQALAMAGAVSEYWRIRNRSCGGGQLDRPRAGHPGRRCPPRASRPIAHCIKAMALWSLGRGAEQPAVWAEAEAIARALGDPVILSRTLEPRAVGETLAGRDDVADALAEEALRCATTAGDGWTIAMAAFGKAMAASNIDELRQRVDRASSLLAAAGNVYHLADMLGVGRLQRAVPRQRA